MYRPALLAAALSAFALPAIAAEPIAPTFADAMRAYYAGDPATCASILVSLSRNPGPHLSRIAYNAARSLAATGRTDAAFESLERAIAADLVSVDDLETDVDLETLRKDARWPAFRARAEQREKEQLTGIDRGLRAELLSRQERDESVRAKLAGPGTPDPALIDEVARIDADNTAWLKQVVATHGWPGKSLVSKDGAKAASLLMQHADHDRAFQKQGLTLLEAAVAKGDTEAADLAYLTDRLLVAEGKPQRYGTQFHVVGGKLVPHPIEDEASVDLLRAFAGLPSLAEYKKAMQQK